MDISLKKVELISWISKISDIELLDKIERLRGESIQELYGSRMPSSKEQLQSKIEKSEKDLEEGRVYGQDEVEQIFANKSQD
ncbi:MAG: hypothetical protein RJQ09_00455 [Cyclobacteriaceae bacterium]